MRDLLYGLLRLSNDVRAMRKGKVGRRVVRRAAGRVTGRAMGRWIR